jgi:hypothetical protein
MELIREFVSEVNNKIFIKVSPKMVEVSSYITVIVSSRKIISGDFNNCYRYSSI